MPGSSIVEPCEAGSARAVLIPTWRATSPTTRSEAPCPAINSTDLSGPRVEGLPAASAAQRSFNQGPQVAPPTASPTPRTATETKIAARQKRNLIDAISPKDTYGIDQRLTNRVPIPCPSSSGRGFQISQDYNTWNAERHVPPQQIYYVVANIGGWGDCILAECALQKSNAQEPLRWLWRRCYLRPPTERLPMRWHVKRTWRNWQTRQAQDLMSLISSWRFKSSRPHS